MSHDKHDTSNDSAGTVIPRTWPKPPHDDVVEPGEMAEGVARLARPLTQHGRPAGDELLVKEETVKAPGEAQEPRYISEGPRGFTDRTLSTSHFDEPLPPRHGYRDTFAASLATQRYNMQPISPYTDFHPLLPTKLGAQLDSYVSGELLAIFMAGAEVAGTDMAGDINHLNEQARTLNWWLERANRSDEARIGQQSFGALYGSLKVWIVLLEKYLEFRNSPSIRMALGEPGLVDVGALLKQSLERSANAVRLEAVETLRVSVLAKDAKAAKDFEQMYDGYENDFVHHRAAFDLWLEFQNQSQALAADLEQVFFIESDATPNDA